MGCDHNGKRRAAQQKTVKPSEELTPKQREKWLNEQVVLFEWECRDMTVTADKAIIWRSTSESGFGSLLQTGWRSPRWPGISRASTGFCRVWVGTH